MPWMDVVLTAVALVATLNLLAVLVVARAHDKRGATTRMPPQLPGGAPPH